MVSTYPIRADLVVQAPDGNIVAMVEVKNLEGLSAEVAAGIRWNLITHGPVGWWSPYFMVVSQETGYLWDQRSGRPDPGDLPTADFPMVHVVESYLPSFVGGGRLSGSQLELAVQEWLADLAGNAEDRPSEPDAALARTGFLEMVRGGRVGSEIVL